VRAVVVVTDARVTQRTRTLRKPGGRAVFTGFTGAVRFAALSEDAAALRVLNQLADYIEFCGAGRMVAQGFGQTWRLPTEMSTVTYES
jgi:CRISPR/Cas system endoribonuclease Cas6 (RAMP superfamily)